MRHTLIVEMYGGGGVELVIHPQLGAGKTSLRKGLQETTHTFHYIDTVKYSGSIA